MRQLRLVLRIVILLAVAAFQPECSQKQTIAGGTSTSENAQVSGVIVDSLGLAAAKTIVYLIPSTYNPVTDSLSNLILTDTTDADGNYAFDSITAGSYNILAKQPTTGTRLLVNNITVKSDSLYRNADTLRATATLIITISDTVINTQNYVYIPGTTLVGHSASSDNGVITFTIDSVPTTTTTTVYYVNNSGTSQPQKLDSNSIVVFKNDTTKTRGSTWMYHKTLYLNTSASGAGVFGTITNFPVLIRLTKSNFNFSQASGNGYDIRFTKSNNTPLHYEIETWDSSQGYAAVWVKLDTILPNNTTQNIRMHWGNKQVAGIDSSSSTAVFDTSTGFAGVWHMNQTPTILLLDATAHHYNGTASGTVKSATDYTATVAGTAQTFDGISTYYELKNTEFSALNFSE